jgi:Double zinc ribbon
MSEDQTTNDRNTEEQAGVGDDTRECPFCRETIRKDAVKCRYCQSTIKSEGPTHGGQCPYCKESIHPEAIKCRYCGSALHSQAHPAMANPSGPCNCGPKTGSGRRGYPIFPPMRFARNRPMRFARNRLGGPGLGGPTHGLPPWQVEDPRCEPICFDFIVEEDCEFDDFLGYEVCVPEHVHHICVPNPDCPTGVV